MKMQRQLSQQGIFVQAPKARSVFADIACQNNRPVHYEKHYGTFSQSLTHVIAHLHEPQIVAEYLETLGAKHIDLRYTIQDN